MKKSTEQPQLNSADVADGQTDVRRRNFLIGASLGTVGAAAAAVGGATVATSGSEVVEAAATEGDGYRETEHVRRYYSTTRL